MDTKVYRRQCPEHNNTLHDCARKGAGIGDKRQVSGVSAGEGVYTVYYYAIRHMAKLSQAAAVSKNTMADGCGTKLALRVVVVVFLP